MRELCESYVPSRRHESDITRGKVGGSGAWPRCVEKRFHGEKIRAANLNIIGNFACCCFDGSVSLNFSPFLSLRNVKDYWISFLFEKSIQIRILSVAAPFGNVSNNSRDRIRELSKKKFYSYLWNPFFFNIDSDILLTKKREKSRTEWIRNEKEEGWKAQRLTYE